MIIYRNSNTDPYFNLATEEYLLNNVDEDIFMLWRNDASVIIGKNQNAYAELDLDYVENNNVKVVRRLTGGGAVFHDLGNVNFTFIMSGESSVLNFEKFTLPIINAIKALGYENVYLSGRNDIMMGDLKISGNAQTSYNGKTLHHGTILYSADLSRLAKALRVDEEKIKSKGIKSVRNRVGNIKELLDTDMDVQSFMEYLEKYVSGQYGEQICCFSLEQIRDIQKLADEKYSTWEWDFGRSKEFVAHKKKRYDFGSVCVSITAENGVIKDIKITGDFFGVKDITDVEKVLTGCRLGKNDLLSRMLDMSFSLSEYISGMSENDLVELLLS